MKHIILLSAVMLVFILAVSSCGRKGDPLPPDKITPDKITIDTSREGGKR